MFDDFLAAVDDGANVIPNKIRGVGHGGGTQVPVGSQAYRHFERFLTLLGGDVAIADGDLTPETLFDGVGMASWRTVMRRAALIFAGRVPTEAEYASMRRDRGEARVTEAYGGSWVPRVHCQGGQRPAPHRPREGSRSARTMITARS